MTSFIDAVRAHYGQDKPTVLVGPPADAGDLTGYLATVCERVATAANGTRNDTLNRAAYTLGRIISAGQIDEPTVVAALTAAGHAAGLEDDEIGPTIASGLGGGSQAPRYLEVQAVVPEPTVIHTPSPEHVTLNEAPKRLRDGAAFILDAPDTVPTLWGDADDVLWARGEALMVVGPPGVGKTTLCGQLLRARLGLGDSHVLGYPVETTTGVVLYLAMDRPAQIARALRRTFTEAERQHLSDHLKVWEGPPPADIAKRPEILLGLAALAGADTVIIDSLKDAAIGLGEDEVAGGYNRARQMCLTEGIEVLELHHLVKRGPNGAKPTTLADVYGSAWLTAGAGSVLLLWGQAGDPIVELAHLKQPSGQVGPFRVIHDHQAGTSALFHGTDLLVLARALGESGITARAAATALFSTERPTTNEVEKARRRLDQLVGKGLLERVEGVRGGPDGGLPTTYKAITEAITVLSWETPDHALTDRSREIQNPRSGDHGTDHGDHATGAITNAPPSSKGGVNAPTPNDQDDEPEEWWKK